MNKAIGKLIMTDQSHMIAVAAADREGRRNAAHGPGAARGAARRARSIPRMPSSTRSDKRPFTRFVADGTAILKADVTQGV